MGRNIVVLKKNPFVSVPYTISKCASLDKNHIVSRANVEQSLLTSCMKFGGYLSTSPMNQPTACQLCDVTQSMDLTIGYDIMGTARANEVALNVFSLIFSRFHQELFIVLTQSTQAN